MMTIEGGKFELLINFAKCYHPVEYIEELVCIGSLIQSIGFSCVYMY